MAASNLLGRMTNGTVKFFSVAKGFGFIAADDGGKEVYVPAAALKGAGVNTLTAGQRVAFSSEAKAKGLEVTKLELLEPVEKPKPSAELVRVYCDPSEPVAADILAAINAAGLQFQLFDNSSTTLGQEQLRRLAVQIRAQGQELVKRFAPMFFELQLDDRFIGESEFWTAVAEHPTLIDGPVLAIGDKARICKSGNDVRIFLGLERPGAAPPKGVGIPPRMAAILGGKALPPEEPPVRAPKEPSRASKEPVRVSKEAAPAAMPKPVKPEISVRTREQEDQTAPAKVKGKAKPVGAAPKTVKAVKPKPVAKTKAVKKAKPKAGRKK
jgi:CspA family cold shock protein